MCHSKNDRLGFIHFFTETTVWQTITYEFSIASFLVFTFYKEMKSQKYSIHETWSNRILCNASFCLWMEKDLFSYSTWPSHKCVKTRYTIYFSQFTFDCQPPKHYETCKCVTLFDWISSSVNYLSGHEKTFVYKAVLH